MAVQIPLTTIFVPAALRRAVLQIFIPLGSTTYSIGGPSPSQCFPSGWASSSQYFSPGICPLGYIQACSVVATAGTVTETRATCCPRYVYSLDCKPKIVNIVIAHIHATHQRSSTSLVKPVLLYFSVSTPPLSLMRRQ
jgi:hypothetical protein